jgi:F0F1-type ATP synthase delta subunit
LYGTLAMEHDATQPNLHLPTSVTSRIDLGRLIREVEALNEFLEQAAIRQPGSAVKMPKTSRFLDEILELNKINVLVEADRSRLRAFLTIVKQKAPVLHMSFSADPSPVFTQKLTTWLRREIHPFVLLQVGLQPNIGAGCVVRTTNKYFDFSLRERFTASRPLLMQKLQGAVQ